MFYKTYHFSGCISQLKISGNNERISPGLVANKVGVTGCETCAVNPCQNGGVCQGKLVNQGFRLSIAEIKFDAISEENSESGYDCLCRPGFNGASCEKTPREGGCHTPGVCRVGICVEDSLAANNSQGFR